MYYKCTFLLFYSLHFCYLTSKNPYNEFFFPPRTKKLKVWENVASCSPNPYPFLPVIQLDVWPRLQLGMGMRLCGQWNVRGCHRLANKIAPMEPCTRCSLCQPRAVEPHDGRAGLHILASVRSQPRHSGIKSRSVCLLRDGT